MKEGVKELSAHRPSWYYRPSAALGRHVKDEHVKDLEQDVVQDVAQDAAQDVAQNAAQDVAQNAAQDVFGAAEDGSVKALIFRAPPSLGGIGSKKGIERPPRALSRARRNGLLSFAIFQRWKLCLTHARHLSWGTPRLPFGDTRRSST